MGKLPFNTWNCISLQLKGRNINLVIHNENDMRKFIFLLIYKMKTVDGNKNSACKILNTLMQQEIKEIIFKTKIHQISEHRKATIETRN